MQYNINVANGTGMEVRTNLNLAHQSLATNFFGATDPSLMSPVCAFPGSTWADTGNGLLKVRNANDSDWIVIGTIEADGTPKLNATSLNLTASDVPNTPSGTISATNVQSAVNSLNVLPLLLRDTAYADDDVAFYAGLPSAMYLQCTTAGTTGTVDITIPSPVAVGDTITDGTVEWTVKKALIDITQYEQELATKANRQLSNLDTANLACHVVVDSYYDSSTGDWWREYDDGWLEQGGFSVQTSAPQHHINFLKPFKNTDCTCVATPGRPTTVANGTDANTTIGSVMAVTTTYAVCCNTTNYANGIINTLGWRWVAYGQGANV